MDAWPENSDKLLIMFQSYVACLDILPDFIIPQKSHLALHRLAFYPHTKQCCLPSKVFENDKQMELKNSFEKMNSCEKKNKTCDWKLKIA